MQNDQLTPEQRMAHMDQMLVELPFWSLLRVYVGFKLFDGKSSIEGNQLGRLKSSLTWSIWQLFSVFRRRQYLFIGNASDLINLNNHIYHRLFYSSTELLGEDDCNVLLKGPNLYSTEKNSFYGSSFLFEAASFALAQLIKPVIYLQYSFLRKELLKFQVDLNVVQIISYHTASYLLWTSHFWIKKPKKIFLSDWYNAFQMGMIRAAKNAGIETIEFQHGVLSGGHYGYFYYSGKYDDQFNPDRFFCFGPHFAKLLANSSVYRPEQTVVIGHPTLDLYKKKSSSVLEGKHIVLVTLQDLILDQTVRFIRSAAASMPDTEFWLLPRAKIPILKDPNITVLQPGKFYEWIQLVHAHVTVFSSTAYEALYFGRPNVLINIENYSKRFMGDLLKEGHSTLIVDTIDEFCLALNETKNMDSRAVVQAAENYFLPEHQMQLRNYFQTDRPI